VFCEKPLGCSAAQTLAVVEIAKCADRLLAIDFSYRFTAAMIRIRELVHAGALGDIYSADLSFHNCYGPDKQWFYDPAQSGGGCVIDLGIHLIDAILWMLDFPLVDAVSADLFSHGKRLARPSFESVEDYAIATVKLDNGVVARLACSWRLPIGRDASIRAVFYGTKASAEFSNVDGSFYDFRSELHQGRERRLLCMPPDNWGGRALIHWAQRLGDSNRFDPAVEGVLAVSQTVDAIYGRGRGEAGRP
jgi:predicted dehydrogenase